MRKVSLRRLCDLFEATSVGDRGAGLLTPEVKL